MTSTFAVRFVKCLRCHLVVPFVWGSADCKACTYTVQQHNTNRLCSANMFEDGISEEVLGDTTCVI